MTFCECTIELLANQTSLWINICTFYQCIWHSGQKKHWKWSSHIRGWASVKLCTALWTSKSLEPCLFQKCPHNNDDTDEYFSDAVTHTMPQPPTDHWSVNHTDKSYGQTQNIKKACILQQACIYFLVPKIQWYFNWPLLNNQDCQSPKIVV